MPLSDFLALVQEGIERNFCLQPFCTTCGALEFRRSLRAVGSRLHVVLGDMDIEQFVSIPRWDEALRVAYQELSFDSQKEVLQAWLKQPQLPIRFVDVAIFYFVHNLILAPEIKSKWIERGIEIALTTHDSSLVESLIWRLGVRCKDYPALLNVADGLRSSQRKIDRALRNFGH